MLQKKNKWKGVVIGRENRVKEDFLFFKTGELAVLSVYWQEWSSTKQKADNVIEKEKKWWSDFIIKRGWWERVQNWKD